MRTPLFVTVLIGVIIAVSAIPHVRQDADAVPQASTQPFPNPVTDPDADVAKAAVAVAAAGVIATSIDGESAEPSPEPSSEPSAESSTRKPLLHTPWGPMLQARRLLRRPSQAF